MRKIQQATTIITSVSSVVLLNYVMLLLLFQQLPSADEEFSMSAGRSRQLIKNFVVRLDMIKWSYTLCTGNGIGPVTR